MAKAPRPGTVGAEMARADRASRSGTRISITLCGSTLEVGMPLPFKELAAVRLATGLPLEAFWSSEIQITEQSCQLMWWLARRANGERRLPLERVLEEWPDELTAGDIEIEEITDDDEEPTTDPEG